MSAGDVVIDAMKHIGALAAGETLAAHDMADGLRALNLMARAMEADGIAFGWVDVTNPAEAISVPERERELGYLLSIELCPRFGATASPELASRASDGMASIMAANAMSQHDRVSYAELPGGYR